VASPFIRVNNGENVAGRHKRNFWDVQGPASYVNGTGIRVDPAIVGLKSIINLDPSGMNSAGLTWYAVALTPATAAGPAYLRIMVRSTGAEVANGVNLSAAIFRFEAVGV
jgi:hypothetical protein